MDLEGEMMARITALIFLITFGMFDILMISPAMLLLRIE